MSDPVWLVAKMPRCPAGLLERRTARVIDQGFHAELHNALWPWAGCGSPADVVQHAAAQQASQHKVGRICPVQVAQHARQACSSGGRRVVVKTKSNAAGVAAR